MEIKYINKEKSKLYFDKDKSKLVMELLWGDRVRVIPGNPGNGMKKVNVRGWKNVYVASNDLGDEALLEIYFIDVGQGDGVMIVTPERKHILIDGGYKRSKQPHGKSAADFVDWKFYKDYDVDHIEIDSMICSHCDADHYGGLWDLLNEDETDELDTSSIWVDKFYHAGVSWWKDDNHRRFLGAEKNGQLTDLLTGVTSIRRGLRQNANLKLQGEWAEFLKVIQKSGASVDRLGYNPEKDFEYLPGYEEDKKTSIKILGPIEGKSDGKVSLKDLGSHSQNTNGHSVLLRVDYGQSRILLTGDLNKKSMRHIINSLRGNTQELAADVVKSCHHGSDDCSFEFLQYVNAAATIISSGDDETHAHPRPNIVAASGVTGFTKIKNDEMVTPLIYSTEISRSLKLGDPYQVEINEYEHDNQKIKIEEGDESKIWVDYKYTSSGALNPQDKSRTLDRLKTVHGIVYGLVNVRTDGKKILCATLNEGKKKWEVQCFESRF